MYDSAGYGYLKEKDLENYIFELMPTFPQLQNLQENFYPFYVITAVRKFFFFLDPKRTGKILIKDMLTSPIWLSFMNSDKRDGTWKKPYKTGSASSLRSEYMIST